MAKISIRDLDVRDTKYIQERIADFAGGMNSLQDDTAIANNEYVIAFNVNNRYGKLEPFRDNTEIASAYTGKKQGILGFGQYIIFFISGYCYYQNTITGDIFKIDNFYMSPTAEKYYVIAIPPSSSNLKRFLSESDNAVVTYDGSITVNGSPAGLLVQDGNSQPWLLYIEDGSVKARVTFKYEDWSIENREYVPVGLDMLIADGILWIVSPDRTRLYRSLTNRPLDFVVSVDADGSKAPNAVNGDALVSSFFITYSSIISLIPFNGTSFIVGTDSPYSYVVNIDRSQLTWAEPRFSKEDLFNAAPINSYSYRDNLGDSVFITVNGIRSFNTTRQLMIESKNDIFTSKIHSYFENILQDQNSCIIEFNNYLLFSVNTIYGSLLAVYDQTLKQWSSFIRLSSKIKQFASLLPLYNRLYAITSDDRIIELFSSANPMRGFVKIKRFAPDDCSIQHKLSSYRLVIEDQLQDGTVLVTAYVDNKRAESKQQVLLAGNPSSIYSNDFPVTEDIEGIENKLFKFSNNPKTGYKIGYNIEWTGGGKLHAGLHLSEISTPMLDQIQQGRIK